MPISFLKITWKSQNAIGKRNVWWKDDTKIKHFGLCYVWTKKNTAFQTPICDTWCL